MGLKLGIIAGEGQLPANVAQSALDQGYEIYILRLGGLADESVLSAYPGRTLNLGQVGGAMQALRAENCHAVVFAGYVTRPDFATIQFDAEGQALLPRIVAAAGQGDDAALGVFIAAFQENGFKVLGAHDIYQDLLCPEGLLTRTAPDKVAKADLEKAFRIAGVIGREDIGQGCIVRDGVVIAVEAQEGTDAMLLRAGRIDTAYRKESQSHKGVLVKRAKPGQERRVDLPTIGVRTIENAAAAGIAGIGLEAGSCLIIDKDATIKAADAAGVFLIGVALEDGE